MPIPVPRCSGSGYVDIVAQRAGVRGRGRSGPVAVHGSRQRSAGSALVNRDAVHDGVLDVVATCSPSFPLLVALLLLTVLLVTVRLRVPPESLMTALLSAEPVIVELEIVTVPVGPSGEPVPFGEKSRPSLFSTDTFAGVPLGQYPSGGVVAADDPVLVGERQRILGLNESGADPHGGAH